MHTLPLWSRAQLCDTGQQTAWSCSGGALVVMFNNRWIPRGGSITTGNMDTLSTSINSLLTSYAGSRLAGLSGSFLSVQCITIGLQPSYQPFRKIATSTNHFHWWHHYSQYLFMKHLQIHQVFWSLWTSNFRFANSHAARSFKFSTLINLVYFQMCITLTNVTLVKDLIGRIID